MGTELKHCIETAEIVCVGTELLVGQTVNTNAAWLAHELSLLGISMYYQTVVGDNPKRLREALEVALGRSDLVITTGGLGPTQDDITMSTAATVFGRDMRLHEPSKEAIESYFQRAGRVVCPNNLKQAFFPEGAIVLPNHNGTAPGAILTSNDDHPKALALLPGPPSEMHLMFREGL